MRVSDDLLELARLAAARGDAALAGKYREAAEQRRSTIEEPRERRQKDALDRARGWSETVKARAARSAEAWGRRALGAEGSCHTTGSWSRRSTVGTGTS